MSYHDVGMLTTEEREIIVETIKKIKKREQDAMKKSTGKNEAPAPNPNQKLMGRFSSRSGKKS